MLESNWGLQSTIPFGTGTIWVSFVRLDYYSHQRQVLPLGIQSLVYRLIASSQNQLNLFQLKYLLLIFYFGYKILVDLLYLIGSHIFKHIFKLFACGKNINYMYRIYVTSLSYGVDLTSVGSIFMWEGCYIYLIH